LPPAISPIDLMEARACSSFLAASQGRFLALLPSSPPPIAEFSRWDFFFRNQKIIEYATAAANQAPPSPSAAAPLTSMSHHTNSVAPKHWKLPDLEKVSSFIRGKHKGGFFSHGQQEAVLANCVGVFDRDLVITLGPGHGKSEA